MPYGSICCTHHELNYQSPSRSEKQNKRAYLSGNGASLGKKKEVRRMEQKQKRTRQKEQQD